MAQSTTITVPVSAELLKAIDAKAAEEFCSRGEAAAMLMESGGGEVAPSKKPAGDDFEREGGKIIRRSQNNVVRAIRQLGLRFETDDTMPGELCIRRPDDTIFFSGEESKLKSVWLEVERRFGFLPTWAFFRTVFLDYAGRNSVANNLRMELD